MKRLFLILAFVVVSCSSDNSDTTEPTQNCYPIIAKGYDNRGDYIIIKCGDFVNKRYAVDNYIDYLDKTTLCEPITLRQQEL
jgi:hypothetical protein